MCAGLEVCRVCRIRWIESLAVFGAWRSWAFSCLPAPLPSAPSLSPESSSPVRPFGTSASSLLPLPLCRLCLLLLSLIPGRLYASTPWRGILSQAIFNPFHVLCPRLPSTSSFLRPFLPSFSAPLSAPLGCGVVSVSSYHRANGICRLGLPGVLRRAMHPIRSMWRWVAAVGRACGCGSRWRRPSRSRAVCG